MLWPVSLFWDSLRVDLTIHIEHVWCIEGQYILCFVMGDNKMTAPLFIAQWVPAFIPGTSDKNAACGCWLIGLQHQVLGCFCDDINIFTRNDTIQLQDWDFRFGHVVDFWSICNIDHQTVQLCNSFFNPSFNWFENYMQIVRRSDRL